MNLLHSIKSFLNRFNPASEWSHYSREPKYVYLAGKRLTKKDYDNRKKVLGDIITRMEKRIEAETSANLVWKKQSHGGKELEVK